jgi:hypothetical protein
MWIDGDSLPNPGAPLRYRALAAGLRFVRQRNATPLVISFPKSGRTWLRVMLDAAGVPAEYTHAGSHVRLGLPFEELGVRGDWCRGRPTVLLVRDPRDTVVSWYFQATRRRHFFAGSLSEFLRHPGYGIEKIARFNLAWSEAATSRPNFQILEYEALRRNCAGAFEKTLQFFAMVVSGRELAASVSAGDFDAMRCRERVGGYHEKYGRRLAPGDPEDPDSYKVRRGVVGGFTNYLDDGDFSYCNEVLSRLEYGARIRAAVDSRGLSPSS